MFHAITMLGFEMTVNLKFKTWNKKKIDNLSSNFGPNKFKIKNEHFNENEKSTLKILGPIAF